MTSPKQERTRHEFQSQQFLCSLARLTSNDHRWARPTGIMTGQLPETRPRQHHLSSSPPPLAAGTRRGDELLLRLAVAVQSSIRWDKPIGEGNRLSDSSVMTQRTALETGQRALSPRHSGLPIRLSRAPPRGEDRDTQRESDDLQRSLRDPGQRQPSDHVSTRLMFATQRRVNHAKLDLNRDSPRVGIP